MVSVNVTEFRRNLPSYLEQVQKGTRIQVTSHGRVIADVGPPEASRDTVAKARLLLVDSIVSDNLDPSAPAVDPKAWEITR